MALLLWDKWTLEKISSPASDKSVLLKFIFSYFKTYVVGAKKNCLNETVLLSTQNKC